MVSHDEHGKILIEAINLCKTNLNQYGSYAYMMLAEAFSVCSMGTTIWQL